jgi:hypothetical protein
LNRAQGVAGTPYQGYTGQEVAPVNQQQMAGIGTINQGAGAVQAAGAPLTPQQIQQYMNPYTNDVVQATQADFANQNAEQLSQVKGNAAAAGALGGDREAVAEALTTEGQNRTQAPVIAGLRSAAYTTGLGTAVQQQGFGLTAAQAAEAAGQPQIAAGTLQQQTSQAQDTQAMQDYYQQQGYPFQVAQWLAGITTGVGSQMGGTSNTTQQGVTQGPTPNPWSQVAGLALTGASLFANRGGRIKGVGRRGYAGGGAPFSQYPSWVPQANLSTGKGAPSAPSVSFVKPQTQQSGLSSNQMKGIGVLGNKLSADLSGPAYGGGNFLTDAYGGSSSSPLEGLSTEDYGAGFRQGGRVKRYAFGGYADGGGPDDETFDDRFYNRAAEPFLREVSRPGAYSHDLGYGVRSLDVPTTAGVGASSPAVVDDPTADQGIFDMGRDPDKAHTDWQGRTDRDTGRTRSLAAAAQNTPAPDLVSPPTDEVMTAENDNQPPVSGVSGLPNVIRTGRSAPQVAQGAPSGVSAYSAAPETDEAPEPPETHGAVQSPAYRTAPPSQPGGGGFLEGLGVHVTPELRQGLLQAGLAMMASTRGGPGSFLGAVGEGGMAGVGAYGKSLELAQKQAEQERQDAIEAEKLRMSEETHSSQMRQAPILPNGKLNPAWTAMRDYENEPKTPFGWQVDDNGVPHFVPGGPADPAYAKKLAEARAKLPAGFMQDGQGNYIPIPGGPADPKYLREKAAATKAATVAEADARALAKYVVATGDEGRIKTITGMNAENKGLVAKYVEEEKLAQGVDDAEYARRKQEFSATGISKNAAARTRATRVANLSMVIDAADAAIPAALEQSEKVTRYAGALVPLNRLIQHGEIATSDENMIPFAMANLQLAEHWARAMNPMGVMRESDRDLALKYLDTAQAKGTYKTAVLQLQKQIHRERDEIQAGGQGQAAKGSVEPGKVDEGKATSGASLPDAARAKLEEGKTTTFGNGQKWTLKNGQPVQVQ